MAIMVPKDHSWSQGGGGIWTTLKIDHMINEWPLTSAGNLKGGSDWIWVNFLNYWITTGSGVSRDLSFTRIMPLKFPALGI